MLSSDGERIAYYHMGTFADPAGSLVVRGRDGREQFLSTRSEEDFVIPWQWTPDRQHVVASTRIGLGPVSMGLWAADGSGEAEPDRVLLSEPGTNFWQGRFSPDGRWLAFVFVRDQENVTRVAVAPAAGGDPSAWIALTGDLVADKPRWSSDGRALYFLGRQARSFLHLWRIGFDPAAGRFIGEPQQLTNFSRPDLEIAPEVGNVELSVTATKVYLTMRGTSGSIWMLDNVDR